MSLALIVIALIVVAFQTLAENVISPKSTSLPGLRKTSSLSVPEAQLYASLEGSVQQEILLCSWKGFYASLDRSVQLEILL